MHVKKSLGQHFLKDQKILKKIVDFAQIEKGDIVVEIGPGQGTLTELLLEKAAKVYAVEKDKNLAEFLRNKFQNQKLEILQGDILEIENLLKIAKLKIENYILVGNIPYYITGAVFKKFLEATNKPQSITFVVQKEVAERIMSPKGSVLSISIKAFGEVEFGGVIKAGSFRPKPKVDSAILAVRNIHEPNFDQKNFFKLLKKGFSHKRKLLKSNLAIEGALLEQCGINPNARAENLSLDNWICLTKRLV